MVVVPSSRDKRSGVPESLHQLKPQNSAIKSERPLKVRDLQMNMAHPDTGIDCYIAHTGWMTCDSIAHCCDG
jgi:hypothetical protein